MILDDRRSVTVKSAGHSGSGRRATYLREIVGSSWLRARYGHPVPGRVLGRISRTRSTRWWMAAFGNLRWCCGAPQSARTGRRLLVRTGAESTYAIGSRVPSMAAWATSVSRRLWLRA